MRPNVGLINPKLGLAYSKNSWYYTHMNISTHADFLENKDTLEQAFREVIYSHLINLSLDELKGITWFSSKAYDDIPDV